ncbi:dehydrodolichyl diphosphate synthase complex subunit DHDDS [Venturia canescens]|uniref:dehydrodolichyl diphosphate synthase complex subunit DHDDS n=1 Tax=Venturia canescens TaxID=32260 RepID=UPI001C9CBFCA|nr:dehydrodolichyl diphosphate synthase complex subunit DHDDS [Venturia canescens]XP_043280599.1 dehydrodolichyl diphosphate synthase complex subunit DHDDS [Venturia canescens]XP_043280600.1 dehydrodolichyl diphosphate synthase complex subunit DHDDS [Venturia canescens]
MSWIRENTLNILQQLAVKIIKSGRVPKHIAFIMDGNRRYANKLQVQGLEGHNKGFDKLAETLQWCLDLGIREVTVYAFSIENFKRSQEEVEGLMKLAKEKFQKLLDERDKLMERGVRIRIIGNLSMIPEDVREVMAEAMLITKDNDKAILNIAFAYTSSDEVTEAIKAVVKGVRNNEITAEDISEDLISKSLYTYDSPEPDLLIRSSGEVRLSDFLLWQISYSCIYFAEALWPEFSIWDLLGAIFYYQRKYSSLQAMAKKVKSSKPMYDNRVASYVNRLQRERHELLGSICSPRVKS